MKRALVALLLLLTLALGGCGGLDYYSSCKEAYMAYTENDESAIYTELDTIVLDEETVLWVAVTDDYAKDGWSRSLVTCLMVKNGDTYRVKSSSPEINYIKLGGSYTLTYDGFNVGHSHHNQDIYMWQWVSTDLLPEEKSEAYEYYDYTFTYLDTEEYNVTLVVQRVH